MAIFVYTSDIACHRIRTAYLSAVLRQNIAWFDNVGAGEVATRISADTLLIQDAIGDKLPIALSHLATFSGVFFVSMRDLPLLFIGAGN
jgi:ATP-binding cassette subfamily B (MDR/TAP) protein 1